MIVPPGSTIGIIGGGQLGRMLAIAARPARLQMPHLRSARSVRAPPMSRRSSRARPLTMSTALAALRRRRSTSPPTSSRISAGRAAAVLGDKLAARREVAAVAQDRGDEKSLHRSAPAPRSRRGDRSRASTTSSSAVAELGTPLVLKTRRYGYDGKGQAWIRSAGRGRGRLGRDRRTSPPLPKPGSISRPNSRSSSRAGRMAARPSGTARTTSIATASCARRRVPAGTGDRRPVDEARKAAAANRRGARPRRRARRRVLRLAPTGRSSTRSRRACTTAATGPSRAPSPRSSSSTSAPSAACRPARPRSPPRRCRWTI